MATSADTNLQGIRVLLVEDDIDTREVLTLGLQMAGAEVTAVATARAAYESFVAQDHHIILSDIGLPGENGYSLLRRIRALPVKDGGRVPAVAVTSFTLADDREQARRAGFDQHVPKPVHWSRLVEVVGRLVRPKPRTAERRRATAPRTPDRRLHERRLAF